MIHATCRHTGLVESLHASRCLRVRVSCTDDDFPDTRVDDRIDARRRLPVMIARFECHMEAGVSSGCTGLREREYLRMRIAVTFMMGDCHDPARAVAHDTTDHGIGFHMAMATDGGSDRQIQ